MIDSALSLDPNDDSEAARRKRVLQGLRQLDGISFVGRIMIEPASSSQYKDANKLANVVLPGEPQYLPVMRGETVAPEPINAKPRKAAETPASLAPAWETPAQPAAPTDVPWAGQAVSPPAQPAPAQPAPAQPTPAAGPAWLNT